MQEYLKLRTHADERLHLIEENVRDYGMFVVDPDGNIASWNLGAERILGYAEEEAVGMNCDVIFTPEDRARGAVEEERGTAAATGRAEDERWHVRKDGTRFWGSGVMTALRDESGALVGYVKILRDETARKTAEEERAAAHERKLAQERHNAVLQERNRIAQEIHDTLAQSFVAISLQLEAAKDALPGEARETMRRIDRAQDLVRQGLAEARRSVWALRPQVLEDATLVSALTRLADETRERSGLKITLAVDGVAPELNPAVEDHLLRICQEAITNVLRHAEAKEIRIRIRFTGSSAVIRIEDDGRGFDVQRPAAGFGLIFMRERTEGLNGRWKLSSEPGRGTRIEVEVPAAPTAAA
jgi:PAS domain S-box-containing protein